MKQIILSLAFGIVFSSVAIGHEEPAKTLREKKEKEEKAAFYRGKKVIMYTVWKHELKDNKPDKEHKEKFLTTRLDEQGNVTEMLVYKNTDTLDYRVAFKYDAHSNMTGETDINPDGSIHEKSEYQYDNFGRVISQINYSEKNVIDSRFTYRADNKANTIIFTKFMPTGITDYQIIYKYDGLVDTGNNTEMIKQKPSGELITRVENRFDDLKQRTQKRIFDANNKLMYYFEYKYFKGTDQFSEIIKKSPEDKVLSKTVYSLNEQGLVQAVATWDAEGKLTSFLSYIYKVNP